MMLAIVGAMILIDRMTAFWFTELIVLIMPIVIIMYATMHSFKDGVMLCVGLLIISFLLGNFNMVYLIYVPIGIVTGLSYAWGVKKGMDKRSLLMTAIITYTVGELIATFVVYPLFGFPVAQMLEQYREAINSMGSFAGMDYSQIFSLAGIDLAKLIVILYVVSTIIMGVMEGVLIHILSIFLLKRFKIKDLGNTNLFEIKPNPPLAYASLLMTSLMYLVRYFNNETLYYIGITISICGFIILLYYGYIFVVLYSILVLRRNVGFLIILLCFLVPLLLYALMIAGFLYASGPLRAYLESKIQVKQ